MFTQIEMHNDTAVGSGGAFMKRILDLLSDKIFEPMDTMNLSGKATSK